MSVNWYVDEGLTTLIGEWKKKYPKATVYTIGDASHASRDSEHNPEPDGSEPGADYGEVDAADFMIAGLTKQDLQDLRDGLIRSRDKRLLYVIWDAKITSAVNQPWVERPYTGSDKHTDHVHVSVNDKYDDNESDWAWEKLVARTIKYVDVPGAQLPLLQLGDDDGAQDGWNHIGRTQVLANWQDKSIEDIDPDGVYGPATAKKLKAIFGGDGKKLTLDQMRKLYGI